MKRAILQFAGIGLLLFAGQVMLMAQSGSYLKTGLGLLPAKSELPLTCYYCNSLPEVNRFIDSWLGESFQQGYGFYAGFGRRFQLKEKLSLDASFTLNHWVYPFERNHKLYERNEPKDLIYTGDFYLKYRLTNWQVSVLLERNLKLLNQDVGINGGVSVYLPITPWEFGRSESTWYLDISQSLIYDSTCHCEKRVTNKHVYQPPFHFEEKHSETIREITAINYGIQVGMSTTVLETEKGFIKGNLSFSQDLRPYFKKNSIVHPEFYNSFLSAGLSFHPKTNGQSSASISDSPKPSFAGIYAGVSYNYLKGEYLYSDLRMQWSSLEFGWLPYGRLGFDLSARYAYLQGTSVLFGPSYKIWEPFLYVKAGMLFQWFTPPESNLKYKPAAFFGARSILPLSQSIGLQVTSGMAFGKKEVLAFHAGAGVILLMN